MFYALALISGILALAGAGIILWTAQVRHAALGLLVALLGITSLYGLQGATFFSAAYLLVQVGGVLLLLLFGAVCVAHTPWLTPRSARVGQGALLAAWTYGAYASMPHLCSGDKFDVWPEAPLTARPMVDLGMRLVGVYNMAFELVGVVVLVALVGAVYVLWPVAPTEATTH